MTLKNRLQKLEAQAARICPTCHRPYDASSRPLHPAETKARILELLGVEDPAPEVGDSPALTRAVVPDADVPRA